MSKSKVVVFTFLLLGCSAASLAGWRAVSDGRPLSHSDARLVSFKSHGVLDPDAVQNLSYLYGKELADLGVTHPERLRHIALEVPKIAAISAAKSLNLDSSDFVEIAAQVVLIREWLQKESRNQRFQVSVADLEHRIIRTLLKAAVGNEEEMEFKMSVQGYTRPVSIYDWRTKADLKAMDPRETFKKIHDLFERAGAKQLRGTFGDDSRMILSFKISKSAFQFLTELTKSFEEYHQMDPSWSETTQVHSVYSDFYFNIE